MTSKYADLVPTDYAKNLAWRRDILAQASTDRAMQRDLWRMCSEDVLFYIQGFGWTYDPRTEARVLPFIPYQRPSTKDGAVCQVEAIYAVQDAIANGYDLAEKKSRDMGATWINLFVIEHFWKFTDFFSALLVSRNEEYVDSPGNPKCLFWKVDFIHKNMPSWLMPPDYNPDLHRREKHLENPNNGSVIDGEATTGDLAAGDRRTVIMPDEFGRFKAADSYAAMSATRDVTNCRLFCSTVKGTGNAFSDILEQKSCKIIWMPWYKHPVKSIGLYTSSGTNLAPDHKGKLRSPWYDEQCKRAVHPFEIQQELDGDTVNSNAQFFDSIVLDRCIANDAREPFMVGELRFDNQSCTPEEFYEVEKGRVRLWVNPDAYGKIPISIRAVIGVDIAAGTGASNSVMSIGNKDTGEKLAEFVDSRTRPEQLGKYAVALLRWFNNAFLIHEANGPGQGFCEVVLEQDYRNIYYREQEDRIDRAPTLYPGWWAGKEEKLSLFAAYRAALKDGMFINRSKHALQECREIIFTPDNSVEHSRERGKNDPSGARFNHGDRPTADALMWKGCKETVKQASTPQEQRPQEVPVGCMQWRRDEESREREEAEAWTW